MFEAEGQGRLARARGRSVEGGGSIVVLVQIMQTAQVIEFGLILFPLHSLILPPFRMNVLAVTKEY